MATLKITGVSEELARFVALRSKALHFKGQAEYLRSLVREDKMRADQERGKKLPAEKADAWREGAKRFPATPMLSEEDISRDSIYTGTRLSVDSARH